MVTDCDETFTSQKANQWKINRLTQTWATYGPRAGSGPRDHFTRPAGTYKNVTLYRESSRTSFTLL